MVAQEWKKFASTGSIQDYLSYKCRRSNEGVSGDATLSMMADRDQTGGSVRRNGADHNADGHGIVRSPGGRI